LFVVKVKSQSIYANSWLAHTHTESVVKQGNH